jgi:hypothetical protein
MTVQMIASIQRWVGLSTDSKPTSVAVGSTFFEYDTKLTYITYDGTNWSSYKYELGSVNVGVSRTMPSITEFWEAGALDNELWEATIDGAGTGTYATSGGYLYYDMDTAAAAANTDVFLNSQYRQICIPSVFGDSNSIIQRFVLEWEAQAVTAVADHDNTHFFMGLSSAKTNDITQQNLIGFYLLSDALRGKCDKAGTEGTTGDITATITNWNKYRITVEAASITFSLNGSDETALTTANTHPDVAMYLVLGTRAEGANAVGLNVGPVRAWYEEVL